MSTTIDSFKGDYRWLSNFESCFVTLDGIQYPSTEHAYQAAKTLSKEEREIVLQAKTPGIAKKLGKMLTIRKDWDDVKYNVMYNLCYQKFIQEPFRTRLLDTGSVDIVEGNTWGDVYWGVCRGVGQNNLGKIIMDIRQRIRDESI